MPTARPSRTSTATTIDSGPWAVDGVANEPRVPERGRAEDDAAGAGLERGVDVADRRIPPAASTVVRVPTAAAISATTPSWRRLPCPRSVEIDDVEDRGASVGEPLRDLDGVVAVDRLPAEVALLQPDDATTPKVDRRDHVERLATRSSVMLPF